MKRYWLLFALLGVVFISSPALSAQRVALVIGNGAYPNVGPLTNPPNDAKLMAQTLRQVGFEVIERIDVNQKTMKRAIKEFGDALARAGQDSIGLFYYAGHGVQVGGTNYLIPTNVEIQDEGDVDIEAVSVDSVQSNMAFAGNRMNIIILDACRNNPFKRSFRSAGRGLAKMDATAGSLIAYATSPGDVAADGDGSNSPYTSALAEAILIPNITVERAFKQVRNSVVTVTKGKQVPWEASSLIGEDFFFTGSGQAPSPAAPPSADTIAWQSISNSKNAGDFHAFLQGFPDSPFVAMAQSKLDQITAVESASKVASAPAANAANSQLNDIQWPDYLAGLLPGPSSSSEKATLPKDLFIETSASDIVAAHASYSGVWRGWMCRGKSIDLAIAVERITAQKAMITYAWAQNEQSKNVSTTGDFIGDDLQIVFRNGNQVRLAPRPDRHLNVRWMNAGGTRTCYGILAKQ